MDVNGVVLTDFVHFYLLVILVHRTILTNYVTSLFIILFMYFYNEDFRKKNTKYCPLIKALYYLWFFIEL